MLKTDFHKASACRKQEPGVSLGTDLGVAGQAGHAHAVCCRHPNKTAVQDTVKVTHSCRATTRLFIDSSAFQWLCPVKRQVFK